MVLRKKTSTSSLRSTFTKRSLKSPILEGHVSTATDDDIIPLASEEESQPLQRRPSTTWSLWRSPSNEPRRVDTTDTPAGPVQESSWWKKSSDTEVSGRSWFWSGQEQPHSQPLTNELLNEAIMYEVKTDSGEAKDIDGENESHGDTKNKLVPSFDILPEYSRIGNIVSTLGSYVGYKSKTNSLHRIPQTVNNPKKKVLIIGVHGFFPTKIVRPLIGEPKGTSTKFITEAEKAVLRWGHATNTPVEIRKIALEKDGMIFDRVDFFYNVMVKWEKEINDSDFVYFVAHSQGCPVSIMLLARLIENGILSTDKKIGILAMAGINNGPFYGVDQGILMRAYSTIESHSLKELFQFQDFDSVQSQKYMTSLRIIIASDVKVAFVGSINDNLVPLYSSTCEFASHPNIFKATFIDKSSQTPDFISRIVDMALRLRNLGFTDHGIIKEISSSLAGTLTGGGHSLLYNEGQVYDLGIKFTLNTVATGTPQPVEFRPYKVANLGTNPFHLPWSMRGLIYETTRHFGTDTVHSLFQEFERWKPETKVLKSIKYRLNGIKSKL